MLEDNQTGGVVSPVTNALLKSIQNIEKSMAYVKYIKSLDESLIKIGKAIGGKEKKVESAKSETCEPGFRWHLQYMNGALLLNGFLLAKPTLASENDLFIEYVLNNPGRLISREEIESNIGQGVRKRFSEILRHLNLTGVIRKMFFPKVSKTEILFENSIGWESMKKKGLTLERFPACSTLLK